MRTYRNYHKADVSIKDRVRDAKSKVDTGLSTLQGQLSVGTTSRSPSRGQSSSRPKTAKASNIASLAQARARNMIKCTAGHTTTKKLRKLTREELADQNLSVRRLNTIQNFKAAESNSMS